jgi:hypothetical protein
MVDIEPLSLLSIVIIQVGSRHLSIELTDYQKRVLKHPLVQGLILFSMLYASTKSIKTALIITLTIYVFIDIVFNDKHEYSIITKDIDVRDVYKKKLNEVSENQQ